jgi:hypothetical protein
MKIFFYWVDFKISSLNSDLINSLEERISLQKDQSIEKLPLLGNEGEIEIVNENDIIFDPSDDSFEVILFGDYGEVTIWTKKKVWCIRKENGREKLIFLPRNPPENLAT